MPLAEGSVTPGTISVKCCTDVSGWLDTKWRTNIAVAENFNRLTSVHECYRRTTDGFAIASIGPTRDSCDIVIRSVREQD